MLNRFLSPGSVRPHPRTGGWRPAGPWFPPAPHSSRHFRLPPGTGCGHPSFRFAAVLLLVPLRSAPGAIDALPAVDPEEGPATTSSPPALFVRGDSNRDGALDLTDAIATLKGLFHAGADLPCPDAADANDSGGVDVSDAIFHFNYLFLGGAEPPPPFPDPARDASPDPLDCGEPAQVLDPPHRIAAAEALGLASGADTPGHTGVKGAIVVTTELGDQIARLPPRASLLELAAEPGGLELVQTLLERIPRRGTPISLPARAWLPVGPDACVSLDPRLLLGASFDRGESPTPADELKIEVAPSKLCGPGPHLVEVKVTDRDGLSAAAWTTVTLVRDEELEGPRIEIPAVSWSESDLEDSDAVVCSWVVTVRARPSGRQHTSRTREYGPDGNPVRFEVNAPLVVGRGALEHEIESEGPGPAHALLELRANPTCRTPTTNASLDVSGRHEVRMNVLCINAADMTLAEINCSADVEVEASCQSRVGVLTDAGERCRGAWNGVEALAEEEVALELNSRRVLEKGVLLHNGNQLTRSSSLQLVAGVNLHPLGWAANFGAQIGTSQTIVSRTGARDAALNVLGGAASDAPILATLTTHGHVELVAEGDASGFARTRTQMLALYALGRSGCPDAGSCAVLIKEGSGTEEEVALEAARDFFFIRTGSETLIDDLLRTR